MRSVMTAQQMRKVDQYMIETLHIPSIVLMENAAMGTARLVMEQSPDPCVVHVFCGTGNNGGDGLACARILLAHGYDVYVVVLGDPARLSADAKTNYEMFGHFSDRVLVMRQIEDLYGWRVPKASVIVDAIFGTGLSRDVLGMHADVIASINSSTAYKIAVDIASGIDTDTGRILGTAVEADCTATFQYPKMGQFLFPGRACTGDLRVIPIGVDDGVEDVVDCKVTGIKSEDPDLLIPARSVDSNKGTYGRLLLLAGSRGMAGAAVMSSRAAYAAGAGLVTVGSTAPVIDIIQSTVPEATCAILPEDTDGRIYADSMDEIARRSEGKTALAIGPGLGDGAGLKDVVSEILTTYSVPRVVDADALNALDKDLKVLSHIRGDVVFTPHPLEFARLLGTQLHSVLEHPVDLALAFAQKCRVTLVLKGATTIIATPDGDLTLVAAGTPGMSKGGSGDVLTGVIGGLLAQGVPGSEAAVLGVYLCAMAGEVAAAQKGEYSMTPGDEIAHLGEVIEDITAVGLPAWEVTNKEKWIAPSHLSAARTPQVAKPAASAPVKPAMPSASSAAQEEKKQDPGAAQVAAELQQAGKPIRDAATVAATTAATALAAREADKAPVAATQMPEVAHTSTGDTFSRRSLQQPPQETTRDTAQETSTQEPKDETPVLTKRDKREERRAEQRRKEYADSQKRAQDEDEGPARREERVEPQTTSRPAETRESRTDRRPIGVPGTAHGHISARVDQPTAEVPQGPSETEMKEARRMSREDTAREDAERERERRLAEDNAVRRALQASDGQDSPQVEAARKALEAAMARREGKQAEVKDLRIEPAGAALQEETSGEPQELPRATLRKPTDRFAGSTGKRMTATDIRPPRIPKAPNSLDMSGSTLQAGSAHMSASEIAERAAQSASSATDDDMRIAQPRRERINREPEQRTERIGREVQSAEEEVSTEAQEHRNQLNAEIQNELRRSGREKEETARPTRRRIGGPNA